MKLLNKLYRGSIILFSSIMFMSCSSINIKEHNATNVENKKYLSVNKNSIFQLKINFQDKTGDSPYSFYANIRKEEFSRMLTDSIKSHGYLTYDDPFYLKEKEITAENRKITLLVNLSESTIEVDPFCIYFYRILSLGFYPQKIVKKIDIEIIAIDSKSNEEIISLESYELDLRYKVPLLVIPFNFDKDSYFTNARIENDKLLLLPPIEKWLKNINLN